MAQIKEKPKTVRLITPEFRVSYPSVFEARKVNENDPKEKAKFSITMIFRVAETEQSKALGEKVIVPADLVPIRKAVTDLFAEKLGPSWAEEIKKRKGDGSPLYRTPFKDGNAEDKRDKDGFGPGTIYARASSQYKPGIVDGQKVEIVNQKEFYGGCYARAQITVFWYNFMGNQGVTFGLDNVQKIRDGQMFGGGMKAEDAFDAIPEPGGAIVAGDGQAAPSTDADPLMG